MPDKYSRFLELDAAEPPGAYRIELRNMKSAVALIAPHGGKIEPGTSEICRSIAWNDLTYYVFEGCKQSHNSDLHITSARFDEPQGLSVAQSASIAVAIHGQSGNGLFVDVGGLEAALGQITIEHLNNAGYTASRHQNPRLQGLSADNICNRGKTGKGVQLEISRGLRDSLVKNGAEMQRFASAIRAAFAQLGL